MSRNGVDEIEPTSPCNRICTIDSASAICLGCARTLDEIAAWPSASTAQKHAILARVAQRQSVSSRST
ncbi:DUF1289 domain-containing protein [Novosphingobium sp. MMS21-SN21R]|uniref:DUF1289 domain-containing protein n=1 Tax=Novosphingobium sp. MMS21-SN21R TaxID=2969298 RepID=UPI0028842118|nr:DUF1289 domain-containing protein [Novosphingobium sp. MMS21-SN21R]MDT0506382.1 DUF1289 domain-containing protein [Novosphingobium sp. MMS21-SN21R]MDT0509479.1 DUF1289 domain-containing protein [Novosphingobium sp. MMS21-SN21R]